MTTMMIHYEGPKHDPLKAPRPHRIIDHDIDTVLERDERLAAAAEARAARRAGVHDEHSEDL